MTLRYKEIGEIISLVDSSSCQEFVLETDAIKLVLRRGGTGAAAPAASAPSASAPQANTPGASAPSPSAPVGAPPETPAAPGPAANSSAVADAPGVVGAPMVGTFYRSPSPEDPPFVEVGSRVAVGDALCIIEVMKLFTTIHAETAGTVREIGPENAQLVEYGQMLFVIDPE